MNLMLACGPNFSGPVWWMIGAYVVLLYASPVLALLNLALGLSRTRRSRPLHLGLLGTCAVLAAVAWNGGRWLPSGLSLLIAFVVINLIVAQSAFLGFKVWRLRRVRAKAAMD